jgi:hypothetical protein
MNVEVGVDLLSNVQHQGAQDAITSLRRRPCVFGVIVCRNRHGANRHDAAGGEQPGAPLAAPGAVVPIGIATATATATAPALVRFPGPYREVGCVDSARKRALRLGAAAEAGPTGPTSGGAAAQQRGQDAEGRHYARMDVSMLRGVWCKEGTERHWAMEATARQVGPALAPWTLDIGHWTSFVVALRHFLDGPLAPSLPRHVTTLAIHVCQLNLGCHPSTRCCIYISTVSLKQSTPSPTRKPSTPSGVVRLLGCAIPTAPALSAPESVMSDTSTSPAVLIDSMRAGARS